MKLWSIVLAATLAFGMVEAEAAKRLGGGKSTGQQSTQVTKREATTPPPASPAATPAQAQPSPAAAAPQAARRPWGAMLGGLAAGLGLAWLASSLGLGAEFAQFLLIGLVVLLGFVLFAAYKRSRQNAASAGAIRSPYALQSAGHAPPASVDTAAARSYNPAKIGNDASARPWEQQGLAGSGSGTASGSMIGAALRSPLEGSQTWGIPADFDVNGFVEAAKRNFVTLQAAWDRSDITTLRSMMTDDMLREIRTQLEEREKINPNASGQTDVMMLNAQLLGIEDLGSHHMASVEFSGMIREDQTAGPAPFREVWNMTKAKDGSSGWLVAGLQALE